MPIPDFQILPYVKSIEENDSSLLLFFLFQSDKKVKEEESAPPLSTPSFEKINRTLGGDPLRLAAEEGFDASRGSIFLYRIEEKSKVKAKRILLIGLGKKDKLNPTLFLKTVSTGLKSILKIKELNSISIMLAFDHAFMKTALLLSVHAVSEIFYQSKESSKKLRGFDKLYLCFPENEKGKKQTLIEKLIKEAKVMSQASAFAKDLVNTPANIKSTRTLTDAARSLERPPHVTVEIITDVEKIKHEMPAFYTVAVGSLKSDPPAFIKVCYRPTGTIKKKIAFVGKSIIFDTGGYQVKSDTFMNTMKADMTGGAIVLAALYAADALQLKNISLSVTLAVTPNKIDSQAMLPDSIINSSCGKQIEIRHTDAEGRVTLIDAVAKAAEERPDLILTIATLTGSASRAVGEAIALMGNNEPVRDHFKNIALSVGDPVQTLDILEQDFDDIKSKLDAADIINTSHNKNRGAQSAATFVMSGAPEKIPFLHLDIAGADMTSDEKSTGIGVRSLISYLIEESQQKYK